MYDEDYAAGFIDWFQFLIGNVLALREIATLQSGQYVSIPYRQCLGRGPLSQTFMGMNVSIPYRQCLGDEGDDPMEMDSRGFNSL